jgi:hypothetical protein
MEVNGSTQICYWCATFHNSTLSDLGICHSGRTERMPPPPLALLFHQVKRCPGEWSFKIGNRGKTPCAKSGILRRPGHFLFPQNAHNSGTSKSDEFSNWATIMNYAIAFLLRVCLESHHREPHNPLFHISTAF